MGPREAGLFGLAGIAGILAASLIGKAADHKNPHFTVGIGVILSTIAYLFFSIFGFQLLGLIIGVIVLDLGNQCGQVSNMARVQALGAQTRSRNNTVFMVFYFIGGAVPPALFLVRCVFKIWGGMAYVPLGLLSSSLQLYFIFLFITLLFQHENPNKAGIEEASALLDFVLYTGISAFILHR